MREKVIAFCVISSFILGTIYVKNKVFAVWTKKELDRKMAEEEENKANPANEEIPNVE